MPLYDLAVHEPDHKLLVAFLKAMEFNTLTRRVAEFAGVDASAIEADANLTSSAKAASSPPPLAGEVDARSAAGGALSTI